MSENENKDKRFIGKIIELESETDGSVYYKILIDNPNPTKADGTVDPWHKVTLILLDEVSGEYYQVLSAAIRNPSPSDLKNVKLKVMNTIMVDLSNKYHVKKLDK